MGVSKILGLIFSGEFSLKLSLLVCSTFFLKIPVIGSSIVEELLESKDDELLYFYQLFKF